MAAQAGGLGVGKVRTTARRRRTTKSGHTGDGRMKSGGAPLRTRAERRDASSDPVPREEHLAKNQGLALASFNSRESPDLSPRAGGSHTGGTLQEEETRDGDLACSSKSLH